MDSLTKERSAGFPVEETRRIIFPIDGAIDANDAIGQAGEFFANDGVSSYVGMLKLNDALHIPRIGPDIINMARGVIPVHVGIFADLKIVDVSATVVNTLRRYAELKLDILTVFSGVTIEALQTIRCILPSTEIALVDTLTDMSREQCRMRFGLDPEDKIARALDGILRYPGIQDKLVDLVVCGVGEVEYLRERFSDDIGYVCPGIRDAWMAKDHQERTRGVYDALRAGATYMVMGTQLSKGNPGKGVSAQESREKTWLEIERYFREV